MAGLIMRIAIISPVFPPYKGGIGSAAYSEAVELARRGHEVVVYTPKRAAPAMVTAGFSLRYLQPFLKYGNAAFLPQLFWKLKNFDVVHLHYPFFGGAEVVWQWYKITKKQKNKKTKLLITYHHDVIGEGILGKFFKWHTKHCMPKILNVADKIIVSSFDYAKNSNIKDIFERQPEKFYEVPFGVDTKKFQPITKDVKLLEKHGLKKNDKIILFVGGLDKAHYFKGVEYLINAKCKVQNAKLLIVGDGDLKPYYQKLAKNLNISTDVIFVDSTTHDDLPKYYNLADVVVLPSIDKSEAFGIVLIEAMACGKSVIASNLPGVRSVVEHSVNGFLVEPKNIEQLVEKINFLLSNVAVAKRYGENGKKRVLEKYSLEKMGENIGKVFLNIVKNDTKVKLSDF